MTPPPVLLWALAQAAKRPATSPYAASAQTRMERNANGGILR